MNDLSKIIIPLFIISIVFYGLKKKINIYESFLEGAKEGLIITFNIFPAVISMVFAINIFLDSNFLDGALKFLLPTLNKLNIPFEIIPMAILRPISGTATLAIMSDVFLNYGPDSYIGRLASILQGCTDTTLYVIALYFASVKITKSRYALGVGLFADFVGIVLAFILTATFF